jgi:hypothetical protein
MSVFKTTFSRALSAIRSDNSNIPFPQEIESGTNTSVVASSLVDSSALFVTNNVKTGDIVYNISDAASATVVSVTNQTTLVLNANIFDITPSNYIIYAASPQTTIGNAGCFLYVGVAGNVKVTTIGGDVITFFGAQAGEVLPVQVIKLWSQSSGTTAVQLVALW